MGEVIEFPVQNNNESRGQLDAHFESEIEAAEQVQHELEERHTFLQEMFPSLFMNPGEVVKYLESTRGRVEEIEKEAA